MASLLQTLLRNESGGRNIANTTSGTDSGQAQGFFQITTGTWNDFGGQKYAPNPLLATYAQQAEVASRIPLNRWAPSTVALMQATGRDVNPKRPLGEVLAANGESIGNFTTAGPLGPPGMVPPTGFNEPPPSGDLAPITGAELAFGTGKQDDSPLASLLSSRVGGGGLAQDQQALGRDQGRGSPAETPEFASAAPATTPSAINQTSSLTAAGGTGDIADIFKIGEFGKAGAIDPATGLPTPMLRTRRTYG